MNTQDKINALEPLATALFTDGYTVDEVCGKVVSDALTAGIAFGEILTLVKTIGKSGGFIVELVDRKKNLEIDLSGLTFCKHTYKQMNELVSFLSEEYDVPEKHALATVKDCLIAWRHSVPTKPLLAGWKLSALECWQDYALTEEEPDVQDVRKRLRSKNHNHSSYTQAYHELYTELVELGKEANNA